MVARSTVVETNTIRILIADDHPIVREGLRGVLSFKPGFEVVGEAEDGVEAVLQATALMPDVVIMDLEMPRKNGYDALVEILQAVPSTRVLILTSFSKDQKINACLEAGAMGCLLKDSSPQELFRAIRDVHRGEVALHPAIARRLLTRQPSRQPQSDPDDLTERENDVLRLIAQGLTNQEIADNLVISVPTVRTHINHLLSKLNLTNRSQAILYALRHNIASLDE
jgi:two-component system, NarL family, response regulator LiaR